MSFLFDLSGKVALVTGAGSGIGRALACGLAAHGADIVAVGRRREKLEETCAEIATAGGRATPLPLDLSEPAQIDDAIAQLELDGLAPEILVNGAGSVLRKPALEVMPDEWDRLMAVNLRAVFFCCQAAARSMRQRGRGRIINVSSLGAEIGLSHLAAYCASKGGVRQLTKALAVEWAPYGITVNALGPGRIRTDMTEPLFVDEAIHASFVRLIPLGRGGQPAELVGAAVFLASDASSYVTGETIYVDGGWLAAGGNPLR